MIAALISAHSTVPHKSDAPSGEWPGTKRNPTDLNQHVPERWGSTLSPATRMMRLVFETAK